MNDGEARASPAACAQQVAAGVEAGLLSLSLRPFRVPLRGSTRVPLKGSIRVPSNGIYKGSFKGIFGVSDGLG